LIGRFERDPEKWTPIFGKDHAHHALGPAMMETLKARDAKDVESAVQSAFGESRPIEIIGAGSKRLLGRPTETDLVLELSALTGIMLYEPQELVLSAQAATPLAEIEAILAAKGQQLAFEPMDYGPLLGGAVGAGTLGGAIAANLSGPRRIKAGAARDHVLGFSAVSGRGEAFKSGGRVMKNVTGFDLCKLMAGSWGTLAVMTELTVKTLPMPETETTVVVHGLDDAAAARAMAVAMASTCEVAGAAHLPAATAAAFPLGATVASGRSLTALRLEGFAPSVLYRQRLLTEALGRFGAVTALTGETLSRQLWRAIRDVVPFAAGGGSRPVWRISTAPTLGEALAARICSEIEAQVLYDWAGGLLWVVLPDAEDAAASLVRAAVAAVGGHAMLVRASPRQRAMHDVFEPQDAGLAALTGRVKESFDPAGLLNPGRMWARG
jgi:glycolate oxidase FAD binding subunit